MTKNTNTQSATFAIGYRVFVRTAATLDTAVTGTIFAVSKGWYVVTLDDTNSAEVLAATKGKVSARVSSLELMTYGASLQQEDVEEALDEAEEHASKMAEALRKARQRYIKTTRPNGAATAHNGDVIAKELRDYEPEDVCKLADRIFALPIGTHLAKYEHLNNGQKRMNAGNRIRGAWRKQEDKEVCDRIANLLGLNDGEDDNSDLPDGTDLAEMAAEQA